MPERRRKFSLLFCWFSFFCANASMISLTAVDDPYPANTWCFSTRVVRELHKCKKPKCHIPRNYHAWPCNGRAEKPEDEVYILGIKRQQGLVCRGQRFRYRRAWTVWDRYSYFCLWIFMQGLLLRRLHEHQNVRFKQPFSSSEQHAPGSAFFFDNLERARHDRWGRWTLPFRQFLDDYTEQERNRCSDNSWCDVDADEKDEDLNVIKLLGDNWSFITTLINNKAEPYFHGSWPITKKTKVEW